MRGDDHDPEDYSSTTWEEVEAEVDEGGYREGFVRVFIKYRGAVLDDVPLDGKGRPTIVNQRNFARHFGIAVSTFHRWLGEFGGDEFAHIAPGGTTDAKERQKKKAARKNQADVAQEVRSSVAGSRGDFKDKLAVHQSDSNFWWTDCLTLLEWEGPPVEKARVVEEYISFLDKEAAALTRSREKLLTWLTAHDASDGTSHAA